MTAKRKSRRFFQQLVRRDAAENYLLMTLLGFAASVILTRIFLELTGYPQLGGGELHIAHVLWGGLLLYAAALLPLLYANRQIYTASALLAGIGVGLFIDEVGKFITQRNDYFFPAAAPIIYALFLLSVLLFLYIRSSTRKDTRTELWKAVEDIWSSLHHPLPSNKSSQLKKRLEEAADSATSEQYANLARVLLQFLENYESSADSLNDNIQESAGRSPKRTIFRSIPTNILRLLLIIGLLAIGLLALKNPFSEILAGVLPQGVITWLESLYIGGHIEINTGSTLSIIRMVLELIVGILLLGSALLMIMKRTRPGIAMGYVGLLLSISTVNILLFYYEQFSTLFTTTIQFLLLAGLVAYQRRIKPE